MPGSVMSPRYLSGCQAEVEKVADDVVGRGLVAAESPQSSAAPANSCQGKMRVDLEGQVSRSSPP